MTLALANQDHLPLAPAREQLHVELRGKSDDAALVRAHPLAAIVDKGRVLQVCGERPAADAVLGLEHEHLDAVAIEEVSGAQPGQTRTHDRDVARAPLAHRFSQARK